MTYLKGSSTWGTLAYDLNRLICGEVADSVGSTCSTPWLREVTRSVSDGVLNGTTTVTSATAAFVAADVGAYVIGTGIPAATTISSVTNGTTVVLSAAATTSNTGVTLQICTDTIRTPAAKDVASGSMSNRAGYYSLIGSSNVIATAAGAGMSSVCKVVNPYTSDPSTSGNHRWISLVRVLTANTVAGTYSTATISVFAYDPDNGATLINQNYTPNAAGLVTQANGHTFSVTDPSGLLTLNTYWVRGFTSTYMYGIDFWPMWYRSSASSPTFSVSPPGSAGTDYDVVSLAYPPSAASGSTFYERSNLFHGLGIKTATGMGSNPVYTLSHNMALAKCRIFASTTNGVLALDVGQSKRDAVNGLSTFRNCGGYRLITWAKCFSTSGSVTSSSAVQYFLSVTNDGIMLALNGDPGNTGKLGTAYFGAYTPVDTTYDIFPIMFNHTVADYTADTIGLDFNMATQYPYLSLKRRMDGSEGSRDWQTKFMRAEHLYSANPFYGGMYYSDVSAIGTSASASSMQQLTAIGATTQAGTLASVFPTRQNKPSADGKWWLYGFQYGECNWAPSNAGSVEEARFVRGQQTTRFLYLPETGWASGDELTDSNTGGKYLLLIPDYVGAGGRTKQTTNTYFGGVAMAQV